MKCCTQLRWSLGIVPVTPTKKGKTLKRYKKKTTGPFSKIFRGVNPNTLICMFWEMQPIKINIKKVQKSVHYPYIIHVPKSPAEMQSHQLWTLVTFFWLNIFEQYCGKSLKYIWISFCESLLQNCAPTIKFIFYEHPLLAKQSSRRCI